MRVEIELEELPADDARGGGVDVEILDGLLNWVEANCEWGCLPMPVARAMALRRALPPAQSRIAELEAQLAAVARDRDLFVKSFNERTEQLTESREREGRMRELLEDMRYELHQYTEGFDVIWGRVDAALAAEKEQK